MIKIGRVVYLILLIILFLCAFMFITMIGEKTIATENITLSPGNQMTYTAPPGMCYIHIQSDAPVDVYSYALNGRSESHETTDETFGVGTPFLSTYTINNSGTTEAHVYLQLKTGVLNPFGYIW